MIVRKSFLIDDDVYARLQGQAKENGLSVGGQVRRLVDQQAGKPNYATPEYSRWINAVCKIGFLHGDDAAQQWIKDNPAPM